MTSDYRPLETQTAAPPAVPPRRPIVGLAMDEDWQARFQELERLLLAAQQATREALARLRAKLEG
jgi:hypothetical protein